MEKINIGVVKLIVSNQLKESYFNGELLVETEKTTKDFFDTVNESPLLKMEMKVFESLDKRFEESDILAYKFINNNIDKFQTHTLGELHEEHKKLEPFMVGGVVDGKKRSLYEAIGTLIEESVKLCEDVDVDVVHESFATVLTHIKNNKPEVKYVIPENINEDVVEMAITKFNDKYENMTSEEINLFKTLVNSTTQDKEKIFEAYKSENVQILESLNEENTNDKITKSIEKINEMTFDKSNADSNIVKLFELKRGLV